MGKQLTPRALRIVLVLLLLVSLAICGYGAWWATQLLDQKAREADHSYIEAELSQQEVETLRRLQNELEAKKDVVDRAALIASTATNYQYQDQVVNDLQTYARRDGIKINSYDFSAAKDAKTGSGPAGTTRTPFTISIEGPLEYAKFMQFLRDVENNLTKLQVTSLALTPDSKNLKLINDPTVSLVVYLKK